MGDESNDLQKNNELLPLLPAGDPSSTDSAVASDSGRPSELKGWFQVDGMTCSACSSSVEAVLTQLSGVSGATVDLLQNRAEVVFQPQKITAEDIKVAIDDAGFEAAIISCQNSNQVAVNIGVEVVSTFGVVGMTCAACVVSLENALKAIRGVSSANVALSTEEAQVFHDDSLVGTQLILDAIEDAGFEGTLLTSAQGNTHQIELPVSGMTSKQHASTMEVLFSDMAGIKSVRADASLGKVCIEYDPSMCGLRKIVEAIEAVEGDAKFHVTLSNPFSSLSLDKSEEVKKIRDQFLLASVLAVPCFFLSSVCPHVPSLLPLLSLAVGPLSLSDWVRLALVTPAQCLLGRRFYVGAARALRRGSANMDVLVAMGTTAAYSYSLLVLLTKAVRPGYAGKDFLETSAMILMFVLFGKYLEAMAKGKTSEALGRLFQLAPTHTILVTLGADGREVSEREVPLPLVQPGDILRVVPGSQVPADGVVTGGSSHVDESLLTGESRAVPKRPGSAVHGGTLNVGAGPLRVRAERVGAESALGRIIRMVQGAQMQKANIQKMADYVSSIFVPLVVLLALLTFLCWSVAGTVGCVPPGLLPQGTSWPSLAMLFAISVLVTACPCAMGLATPTAVMVATGVGARLCVLFKGARQLESACQVSTVVFDKTGTLTRGQPLVVHLDMVEGEGALQREALLRLLGSAEAESGHPVGRAVAQYARHCLLLPAHQAGSLDKSWMAPVTAFEEVPGCGVRCTVAGRALLAGNARLMADGGVPVPREVARSVQEGCAKAWTPVLVALEGRLAAVAYVGDAVKREAGVVVAALRRMGVHSVMITGDSARTAQAVAQQVGIMEVLAQVLPAGKAAAVRQLQQGGRVRVAMVGDGVNDAPALAAADVGMAIGAGADVAVEAADVVLLRDSLEDVLTAIDLSRATIARIRWNYVFALGYNVLAIPLAAGALYPHFHLRVPPWMAGAMMAFSSVSVVCSSLMLRRYRRPNLSRILFSAELEAGQGIL